MWKVKTFTFVCLFFLFILLFHNCAPLTEQGNFKEADINVFNSEDPGTQPGADNDDGTGDEERDDETDTTKDETDTTKDDKDNDEPDEPIGEEFDGSETPESGGTPITRGLY